MADRDVEVDAVLRDKTGPGVQSVARNLKQVERSWKDVDGQGKKTVAAAQQIAGQWGRGLSKISGAASKWANSGDSAGKRFVRGVGAGIGKLASLGGQIGGSLSKAVSAAGPYVQVALAAVLAAAAVAAAPAIAGAIVGGAGVGGILGGVMIARKDARVAGALDDLSERVGSGLQDAAKRFVPATLGAIKEAEGAFRGMRANLKRIFDVSANWVAPLTRSLGKAASLALDGITKAVTKAGPIIAVIGQGVESIGAAVGKFFADLSDNGASMALALKGVFFLVSSSIENTGKVLNFLVEAFEFFVNKIPGGKQMLDSMAASQDTAKTSTFNLASGFQALATDSNAAALGITRVKERSDELVNGTIGLARAQIASRDATRQASQAIAENATAKLTNRQRSDANKTALLNMADAFNQEADAGDKSKISAQQASTAYATNRQRLIAMAEKAGYTAGQAQALAARLLKIPKNVTTSINANTSAAMSKVETFQKKVRNLQGKTVTITVRVNNRTGDHYIPGVGTQVKGSAATNGGAWASAAGDTTARTGGPRRTEIALTNSVYLDGTLLYRTVDRRIAESEQRTAWRQKVGTR
ncbi:hypothetical protein ABT023_16240 [Micromonospora sp. NPDC002296]|uniref:hypothetical protein n=1 Tax=Micromonospora sp. NPDC002296 TaxID=3154271 RepID=UPI0033288CFF